MRQKSATPNSPSERLVTSIRRATRKQYSAEEKIRIVLDGLRGESLEEPELSLREVATRFTDVKEYFVSEASVYRLLKAHDLITSPAFIVVKTADEFKDKTTAPNQLWQTDFTYLKVIGWSWFYLSTILDDFSRYIIAWKLCTTMKADDVTDTRELALSASGCESAKVAQRPRQIDSFVDHYNHQRYHEAIAIKHLPMSTSAEATPSCWNKKRFKRQTIHDA